MPGKRDREGAWGSWRRVGKSPGCEASPTAHREENSHLLRDSPGTLYELLLGIGVTGATLQGACLGHQGSTSMAQLLYSVLDVGTYL